MKFDAAVNAYKVYENEVDFVGHAQLTLPNLTALRVVINGSGIMGNVGVSLIGHYDAMQMTLNFKLMNEATARLNAPRRHNISVLLAHQSEDAAKGAIISDTVKHIFVAQPATLTGGTVAPAVANDGNILFDVKYWAQYINGAKVLEIDPLNRICFMDGQDWLQPVRTALGE
mgnify:CR=1 FL=1